MGFNALRGGVPIFALAALAFIPLLYACGQSSPAARAQQPTGSEQSTGTGLSLGAPAELLKLVSAEPTPYKLDGASFSEELPHDGASSYDGNGHFYAYWNRVWEHQVAEPGYAIYHFNLPDYNREPLIEIEWAEIPADLDARWFGLANWERGTWDWFPVPTTPWLEISSLDKYFSDEDSLLIAFVTASNYSCSLASLRVGLDPDFLFSGLWLDNVNTNEYGTSYSFNFECIVGCFPAPYNIAVEFNQANPDRPPRGGTGAGWYYTASNSPFGSNGIIYDYIYGCSIPEGYYWVCLLAQDGIGGWRSAWWPEPVYLSADSSEGSL